jgi:hypothetical protein
MAASMRSQPFRTSHKRDVDDASARRGAAGLLPLMVRWVYIETHDRQVRCCEVAQVWRAACTQRSRELPPRRTGTDAASVGGPHMMVQI